MNANFSRLTKIAILSLLLMSLSGVLVSTLTGAQSCPAWPVCLGELFSHPTSAALHLAHRLSVLVASISLVLLTAAAWREQNNQVHALTLSTLTATFFIGQAMLGARLAVSPSLPLLVLHRMSAMALWTSLALYAIQATRHQAAPALEPAQPRRARQMARDFLSLTKPVVVTLLLVTTYAGMVIGAQRLPSPELAFFTLLGGFLAAGGASAINQYLERQDDLKMQRTQTRPLPAGRLTPAEGLAFGLSLCVLSIYVMVTFVNLLAAALTLCGILYYVVVYTMLLKKATAQNIVIGGGAGAIPPLVGWAATTGSLNVPALFLFAIVFMWTPPHFWALALVRKQDYARAGVPMLPVVRGEAHTRTQILIYTLQLVLLTLCLPVVGLGGAIYFSGALALGGWLLFSAYRLWRQAGNKIAWKMYRYSSMYLAFLFFVLMIDRLF